MGIIAVMTSLGEFLADHPGVKNGIPFSKKLTRAVLESTRMQSRSEGLEALLD